MRVLRTNTPLLRRQLQRLPEFKKEPQPVLKILEKLKNDLDRLAEKQEDLSNESDENNTKEKQEDINKEFEDFKKELEDLQKDNKELKQPIDVPQDKLTEKEIYSTEQFNT